MAKGVKTGGREKGTPNRLTKELRQVLKDLLHQELENLSEHLNSLEPKERLNIIVKLLPYIMAKMEPVKQDNFDFDTKTPDYTAMTTEELIQLSSLYKKIGL